MEPEDPDLRYLGSADSIWPCSASGGLLAPALWPFAGRLRRLRLQLAGPLRRAQGVPLGCIGRPDVRLPA